MIVFENIFFLFYFFFTNEYLSFSSLANKIFFDLTLENFSNGLAVSAVIFVVSTRESILKNNSEKFYFQIDSKINLKIVISDKSCQSMS